MEASFDYSQVPSHFIHCFNPDCPMADNCLRRLAASHATGRLPVVQAVNPAVWPAGDGECPHFTPVKTVRQAWGLRNALDRMPHKQAEGMKRWLVRFYPRMTLSRVMNHKRPIPPQEQQQILRAFRTCGMEDDDVFDKTAMSYDW